MSTKFSLEFSSSGDLAQPCISGARAESLINLRRLLQKMNAGTLGTSGMTVAVSNTAVQSSGTITLASCAAGTVVEVNGVPFTAVNGTAVAANNEFDMSGDDTADAAALAAAINACTSTAISGVVTATSSLGVVTVTATKGGYAGNAVTIKTLGILASGTITAASVAANDTVTLNGVTLTAKQQRATGTVAFSTAVAGNTVTVNGVTFTAVAGTVTLGQPYFSIDTGDTETATSFAAQVNAYGGGTISGIVTATSSSGTATLRAVSAGTAGNSITLTKVGSPITVSGATLSGGIAVANNEFECKGTNTQVATDLARCINASTSALVNQHFRATSSAAVVTLYAKYPGVVGNANTTASSSGSTLAIGGSAARLLGGTEASSDGAQASVVLTLSSGSGNYTITINGVNATGTVAYNASDNQTAADLADAINKSTNALVAKQVYATASTNTITVTSIKGGVSGNNITIACTGTNLTIAASATRLSGGAVPTTVVLSGDRLASGSSTQFTLSY